MTDKTSNTAAAVAGAVVGAGVAVAATKLATDKKMRDKVKETFTQVKDQVLEVADHSAMTNQKGGRAAGKQGKKSLGGNQQKS